MAEAWPLLGGFALRGGGDGGGGVVMVAVVLVVYQKSWVPNKAAGAFERYIKNFYKVDLNFCCEGVCKRCYERRRCRAVPWLSYHYACSRTL